MVLVLQVRSQEPHRGQVQQPFGQHRYDHREPARGVRGLHAVVGTGFGAVQHAPAIAEQRLESARQMQAATFELDEMGDQLGTRLTRPCGEGLHSRDERVVREVAEVVDQDDRIIGTGSDRMGPNRASQDRGVVKGIRFDTKRDGGRVPIWPGYRVTLASIAAAASSTPSLEVSMTWSASA